jgi:hypothetical protein
MARDWWSCSWVSKKSHYGQSQNFKVSIFRNLEFKSVFTLRIQDILTSCVSLIGMVLNVWPWRQSWSIWLPNLNFGLNIVSLWVWDFVKINCNKQIGRRILIYSKLSETCRELLRCDFNLVFSTICSLRNFIREYNWAILTCNILAAINAGIKGVQYV